MILTEESNMNHKPKLELTWIGKDQQPKLEPRILIEDPEKTYGDTFSLLKLLNKTLPECCANQKPFQTTGYFSIRNVVHFLIDLNFG